MIKHVLWYYWYEKIQINKYNIIIKKLSSDGQKEVCRFGSDDNF